MTSITLAHWLVLSSAIFSIGIYGFLTRKSAVGMLMSLELLMNSAVLNFLAFDRYNAIPKIDGELMGLFIIALAACEVVVAFAIFLALFKHKLSLNITKLNNLKG